jgi:putative Ca2+/H+ antiporter (TMEM165/GDT1 family)
MSVSGNCVFVVFPSLTVCYNCLRHWGVAARRSGVCVNTLGLWPWRRQPGWFGETFGIGFLHPGWAEGPCQGLSPPDPDGTLVEAFFVSAMVVGLAEIGDKTQILSLMLAARFLRPLPIIFGILCATLANHAAAGLAGTFLGSLLTGEGMRWVLVASFLSVAIWALFPDRVAEGGRGSGRSGAFLTTLVAFFLAEIGDKTQIATVALAARFEQFYPVVIGTTCGMMLANIPAVLVGHRLADKLPVRVIRIAAAIVFVALAALTLAGTGG